MAPEEHLQVLREENARFAAAATAACARHGWRARVPGCPDWDLADLVWHLAGVQHFWGWLVRARATSPTGHPDPVRPADDELPAFLADQARALEDTLTRAAPADRVWTWAPQQDVAFVLRRQAQEATVHRVDAEQVLGEVTPIATGVGMDGLDEWLEVMVPGALPDGPPAAAEPVVFHAVDADAQRRLFAGSGDLPVATLTGPAGDLLLAAWRRVPLSTVTVDGNADRATELLATTTVG
ncbi:maleylpyruvate isomerase family mycothiol-dependent enzyme [Modestobacter excelsi]|uniref:maleylpyruvate isomerase family mycothiol-dependent enzyme n=1 Tax=Modestobacter excelsi TaxID=2213161 RepID=UPI00110CAFEA|nr:maleylpyruvate isomerase family mycothiol-dependent enzyme [Modestobacter excelsi]